MPAMMSNNELLQKAMTSGGDLGGAGQAPLNIEQVQQFLRLAITPQVMLNDVRTVMSNSALWEESKIEFGDRVMHAGTEATRLAAGSQSKPTTGVTIMSTVLIRGEVVVSDEVLEDQVERAGFGDTVMNELAQACGRDIEELFIKGDTNSTDAYLALQNGWLKLASTGTGANVYNASGDGQDYQNIFRQLLHILPDRFKRDIGNMRYYTSKRLEEKYRDQLAARGTALGDQLLTTGAELAYQGIPIRAVPLFPITAGSPDTSYVLLIHRSNLYAGYRREIKLETWRDPREGGTSFVASARVNSQIGHIPASAIATNVNLAD